MSDCDVTCLFCGKALTATTGLGGTVWIHRGSRWPECEPTYACPVFPGDVIWREPLDARPAIIPAEETKTGET